MKQRQTPIPKGIQTQHNLGDREEVNEAEAADVWGTIDLETCAPGLETFRCIMAQEPDFCLNLTDGDVTHTPTPAELQKEYTQAEAVSTLTTLKILAKEVVKNVQDGEFETGDTENIVFALWCLLSQNAEVIWPAKLVTSDSILGLIKEEDDAD